MLKQPSLFSFFIFLAFSSTFGDHHHPLDPLTPAEFISVRTIIEESYPTSSKYNLTFQYVGLDEPDKKTILSWQSKSTKTKTLPRRAFVITRFNKQSHEIVVDLWSRSIVSKTVHEGQGYPLLTLEEQVVASQLPFSHAPFVDSVRKRELNMSQVVCSTFSVGWFGEEKSKRTLKIQCFYTNGTVNLYARPLEGITVVVDLDEIKIVEYHDRFIVPVPKGEGTEYRFSKLKPPFGPHLNTIAVESPDGPGFTLDGHTIRSVRVIACMSRSLMARHATPFYSLNKFT